MDPNIGWYQPEQFGPAKDLWLNIWESEIAEKRLDILTLKNNDNHSLSNNIMGNKGIQQQQQQDYISLDSGLQSSSSSSIRISGVVGVNLDERINNPGGGGGGGGGGLITTTTNTTINTATTTTINRTHNIHNTSNSYYNPSRRKSDNRASTYGMNYNYDILVGEYGGCPWRQPNKHYSKAVFG